MAPAALVLLAIALAPVTGDPPLEQAEWLFLNRHREAGYADSALVLAASEHGVDALALRARMYCQLGEEAKDRAECQQLYLKARATADSLRQLDDDNTAGHLWWASAQGRLAKMQGMLRAASVAGDVRRELERAVELDPGCAYARYALGRMLLEMPGVLGGSASAAEVEFRAALAADPALTIVRLDLARLLDRERGRVAAAAQLDTLLATAQPSHPAEYYRHDLPAASSLFIAWHCR